MTTVHGISDIDHPVIAVRDMAAARPAYERLGFTIPPRGSHLEWGTGNWCIMFERDYLELRGIIDATRYTHGLDRFLEKREGLMGVALATLDAAASYQSLVQCGLHPSPVRPLTRNFELPEGNVQPRFQLCFLDEKETPGLMSVVLCQHLTPELLRRPDWTTHANGALRVSSITAVVENLAAATVAYERLFAARAAPQRDDVITIRVGHDQTIVVMSAAAARRQRPGTMPDWPLDVPCLADVTLQVRDVAVTEKLFVERQVDFVHDQPRLLRVGPDQSCGVVLRFTDRGADII